MEYEKIINLLGTITDNNKIPRFITKKWIEIHDQSNGTYNINKDIRFKTLMLRSNLCDFNEAYIVVKGKITVTDPKNDAYDKKLALKDNAPFFSCILKLHDQLIDDP